MEYQQWWQAYNDNTIKAFALSGLGYWPTWDDRVRNIFLITNTNCFHFASSRLIANRPPDTYTPNVINGQMNTLMRGFIYFFHNIYRPLKMPVSGEKQIMVDYSGEHKQIIDFHLTWIQFDFPCIDFIIGITYVSHSIDRKNSNPVVSG